MLLKSRLPKATPRLRASLALGLPLFLGYGAAFGTVNDGAYPVIQAVSPSRVNVGDLTGGTALTTSTLYFWSNDAERAKIDNNGLMSIGLGTATAASRLHVHASDHKVLTLGTANGNANVMLSGLPTGVNANLVFNSFNTNADANAGGFVFNSGDPNAATELLRIKRNGPTVITSTNSTDNGLTVVQPAGGNILVLRQGTNTRMSLGHTGNLQVTATDHNLLRLTTLNPSADVAVQAVPSGTGNLVLHSNGGQNGLVVKTGAAATEVFRVTANGRVGINNNAPSGLLDVRGGYAASGAGAPIVLAAQGGASANVGGNVVINSGANGLNSQNGSIIFGIGGTLSGASLTNGERMRIDPVGRVGIGKTTPGIELDIAGRMRTSYNSGDIIWGDGQPNNTWGVTLANKDFGVRTQEGGDAMLTVKTDGRVGIGTTTPEAKLHVAGDMKVAGVISVKTWSVAPDYVFEKDYKLASLTEVDAFVRKNKHLPEVPSAKEIAAKGLDLAEMNLTLLKKVEELTLHAIRQEKRIRSQDARLAEFERKLSAGNP